MSERLHDYALYKSTLPLPIPTQIQSPTLYAHDTLRLPEIELMLSSN